MDGRLGKILQSQLPTPEPTPEQTPLAGSPTFDNYVGALFGSKCTGCHGELATAGLKLLTYADTLNGSAKGAVILPGDSANSLLVQVQSTGKHFANLTPEELELVKQWIDSGAPEK